MISSMIALPVRSIEPIDGLATDRLKRVVASAGSPGNRPKMRSVRPSSSEAQPRVLAARSFAARGGSIPAPSVQVGSGMSLASLSVKRMRRSHDEEWK